MVLIGEIALYIGCMGLSAIVTRITILNCLNGDETNPDTQENDYNLIEDNDTLNSSIESNSDNPEMINLFSPRRFRNNFEISSYSSLNSVVKRMPPIYVTNVNESKDIDDSFIIEFKSLSEDSEEKESDEEIDERRELTPVLDLDASKFHGFDKNADLYFVKEYYYALAKERFATDLL